MHLEIKISYLGYLYLKSLKIILLIKKCIDNVEKNLILLHELNPNVEIFSFSCYYSPLYDKIQRVIFLQERLKNKNKKYTNKFAQAIDLYNFLLQKRNKKYHFVSYIDITFLKDYCTPMDFHSNTIGNELIANKILEKLEYEKGKKLVDDYENTLILRMIRINKK